jgi:hypothetical protein
MRGCLALLLLPQCLPGGVVPGWCWVVLLSMPRDAQRVEVFMSSAVGGCVMLHAAVLLPRRWLEVLRCISRWELLQQIASGMPTDAVLFAAAGEKAAGKGSAKEQQARKLSVAAGAADGAGAGGQGLSTDGFAQLKRCLNWQRAV